MRRLYVFAITLAVLATTLTLTNGVTGAGAATSVRISSIASANGSMSSESQGLRLSLAELGWTGRSESANYAIHTGTTWVMTVNAAGAVPPIPIPSVALWGLVVMAAAFGVLGVWLMRGKTV